MTGFIPATFTTSPGIFGPTLRQVRYSLGVTQRELSAHSGIPESSIATYEIQHRSPSLPALVRIAVTCGVDPSSAAAHARMLPEEGDDTVIPFFAAALVADAVNTTQQTGRLMRLESSLDAKLYEAAVHAQPLPSLQGTKPYLLARVDRASIEDELLALASELEDTSLFSIVQGLHAVIQRRHDGFYEGV